VAISKQANSTNDDVDVNIRRKPKQHVSGSTFITVLRVDGLQKSLVLRRKQCPCQPPAKFIVRSDVRTVHEYVSGTTTNILRMF
jgi:hypothetical protein